MQLCSLPTFGSQYTLMYLLPAIAIRISVTRMAPHRTAKGMNRKRRERHTHTHRHTNHCRWYWFQGYFLCFEMAVAMVIFSWGVWGLWMGFVGCFVRALSPLRTSQKLLLCFFHVGLRYGWRRLEHVSSSRRWAEAPRGSWQQLMWRLMLVLEKAYHVLAAVNFVAFLFNGTYRSLPDRFVRAKLNYIRPNAPRTVRGSERSSKSEQTISGGGKYKQAAKHFEFVAPCRYCITPDTVFGSGFSLFAVWGLVCFRSLSLSRLLLSFSTDSWCGRASPILCSLHHPCCGQAVGFPSSARKPPRYLAS